MTEKIRQTAQSMILYSDEDLVILNKPSGLPTQGGTGIRWSVQHLLPALKRDGDEEPRLVHRLDRDTSGVLVIARTYASAVRFGKILQQHATNTPPVAKVYWALVHGKPVPSSGRIVLPLAKTRDGGTDRVVGCEKDKNGRQNTSDLPEKDTALFARRPAVKRPQQMVTLDGRPVSGAQIAITEYHVIDHVSDTFSWLELRPITGRMHQLRYFVCYYNMLMI